MMHYGCDIKECLKHCFPGRWIGTLVDEIHAIIIEFVYWLEKESLNIIKTEKIIFSLREIIEYFSYRINESIKLLRVLLDKTFVFYSHINHLAGILTKAIFLLDKSTNFESE